MFVTEMVFEAGSLISKVPKSSDVALTNKLDGLAFVALGTERTNRLELLSGLESDRAKRKNRGPRTMLNSRIKRVRQDTGPHFLSPRAQARITALYE